MWESARLKRAGDSGYPSFSTQNKGFFTRHMRRLSSSLPRFHAASFYPDEKKDKASQGSWSGPNVPLLGRLKGIMARMGRKMKIRLMILLLFILSIVLFYNTRECSWPLGRAMGSSWLTSPAALVYHWRRSTWLGGGQKYVIILAANVGGGVMEWKGAREWAIERDSVRNKKKYVANWGYDLEIVDMSTKKRYAHEWRESWEKVDFIRSALRKYPKAEW